MSASWADRYSLCGAATIAVAVASSCGPALDDPGDNADDLGQLEAAATGLSPITITSTNLRDLQSSAFLNNLLRWSCGGSFLTAAHKYRVMTASGVDATSVCDPWGGYCGECVSLIKSLSGRTAATPTWRPGANVMSAGNLAIGIAIATFPNGVYDGHTAFFAGYTPGGFLVWDENWQYDGLVRYHAITGASERSYFVVLAP